MFKKFLFLTLSLSFCVSALAEDSTYKFTENDRLLVIAPHPDDEALGLGGLLQSALEAKATVKIVYLTNGEANEVSSLFYQKRPLLLRSDFLKSGKVRKKEAIAAMGSLGLPAEQLTFFGYPDGGMLSIWLKYWGFSKPFRSIFTRIQQVPYEDDYSYGRPFKGDNIVHDFERVILDFSPSRVFVTAPFDLNLDHQAAYLYCRVALLDLEEQLKPPPQVFLYLVHAHHWPEPKKYLPTEPLPIPSHIDWNGKVFWNSYSLKKDQVEKKRDLILGYKSQVAYKKNFLLSFARSNELFMDYPHQRLPREAAVPDPLSVFGPAMRTGDVLYRILGDELLVEIPLTNSLDEMGVLSSYVFSYRKGFLFSEMPKLSFKLFGNKLFVYDGFHSLYDPRILYKVDKGRIFLRIPLAVLKQPDILFVSTRTAKEEMSLDFGSWRTLEVV